MDKIVSKVAALGIPGLVLIIAMGATGLSGAAAVTTALAALGPGGMIGGIAVLGVAGLLAHSISEYGVDVIFSAVVKELIKKGETEQSIRDKIDKYPVSQSLKRKLREELDKNFK